jgi:hypothetical protein
VEDLRVGHRRFDIDGTWRDHRAVRLLMDISPDGRR